MKAKITELRESEYKSRKTQIVRIECGERWIQVSKELWIGSEKPAWVNYNGGYFGERDFEEHLRLFRFAAQIARRLDARETIIEGEEYDG